MAPMNWFIMFVIFITIFLISINKIYHIFFNNDENLKNKNIMENSIEKEISNVWKW